ncbi:MAG TPA: hypothetical protein VJV23_14495 [Candidatus Polarisedimenticolia bacterium]|nr:hypothetical protein [Candidatus Polarisedimenticolia bacterium]
MRARCRAAAAALLILPAAMASAAAAPRGEINLFGGVKWLDQDVWEPVEKPSELGLELSLGSASWPVLIAIDAFRAEDDADDGPFRREVTTTEVAVGVRKIWQKGRARPYLGGGLDAIRAEVETTAPPAPEPAPPALFPDAEDGETLSDDDQAIGPWVGGGVFWRLGSHVNLGIAARFSAARVEFQGDEVQAGGLHAGVLLGFGWPAEQ